MLKLAIYDYLDNQDLFTMSKTFSRLTLLYSSHTSASYCR